MNLNPFRIPAVILLGLSLSACANGGGDPAPNAEAIADTVASAASVPAGDGIPALNSPERKLVHTANLHAEVKSLYDAASRIESATLRLGGQVTNSHLHKNLLETSERNAGSDSLTSFRRYQGTAELSLRVPVAQLDTLLQVIAAQAVFIDDRQLHIDDATYRYLANTLRNEQAGSSGASVPGVAKHEVLEARRYLDQQRSQSVDRKLENMQTADQAAFASLSIELSQPEELVLTTHADLDRAMRPGAGQRLFLSLQNGWEMLYSLMLGLLGIWPLCLITGFGIWTVRRWYRRQHSSKIL